MKSRTRPAHYKPEEVEEHQPSPENGFTSASHAGATKPRPFRKPTAQTRQAAEQATRNALMDCYNG